MSLATRLLSANPGAQVSTALTGALTTPGAKGAFFVGLSYDSISTATVTSGGTTSITFSSIPATYAHLQLRCFLRSDRTDSADGLVMNFNGDTASNYSFHGLRGDGTNDGAEAGATQTFINIGPDFPAASATSGIFGIAIIDILDYANTNKYKTSRHLEGHDRSGAGAVGIYSGNWRSTVAINSITLDQRYGSNFAQYSSFALYGIK